MIEHKKTNFINVPSWDDIIKIINYKYSFETKNKNESLLINNKGQTTDILLQGRMYMHIWDINNKDTEKFLEKTDYLALTNSFQNNYKSKISFNLAANHDEFIKHYDPQDVLTWQCVGSVKYIIEENDTEKEYLISPGDTFFMTAGTVHRVVAIEPRVSIIFDFSY